MATGLARLSPVPPYSPPSRDGSRPCIVSNLYDVLSRRKGDGLVNLFRRKLRARTVEHCVVVRAGRFHRQGSCLIIAAAARLNFHRDGDVVEPGAVGSGDKREWPSQMGGSQLRTRGISDGV